MLRYIYTAYLDIRFIPDNWMLNTYAKDSAC